MELGARYSVIGSDQMSLITPYRFDPVYTMCHVGFDELFRPTGGQLVFRFTRPTNNISRNIMTREYNDILTLNELHQLMTDPHSNSKLIEMYRPLIEDDEGKISLVKLANNVIPFGVTSIYQCKDWHKELMTTVQPVLINGACHVDRTDYTKQDTLRIPVDMCEITKGRPENPKHFVYLTFHKPPLKDWQPKLVVTPLSNYSDKEMKNAKGYSLVFPLGIIDYLNNGMDNTSVYLFRPASVVLDNQPEEPVWMIEGFVFHTLSEWRLTYDKDPIEFYTHLDDGERWKRMMLDPGRRFITGAVEKMMAAEDDRNGNTDDHDDKKNKTRDDADEGEIGGKRKRGGGGGGGGAGGESKKRPKHKHNQFYGFGTVGCGGADGREFEEELRLYHNMTVNDRNSLQYNPPTELRLDFALHRRPYRKVNKHTLTTITKPFQGKIHNFMDRLNSYVERQMQKKTMIQTYRLTEGHSTTMDAEDIYLVLAMAFLDRLMITGDSAKETKAAKIQINMDNLFDPPSPEKLKCLVNYFIQGMTNSATFFKSGRAVTFFHKPHTTSNEHNTLYNADQVLAGGPKIEDVKGAVWADFANNRFGGGVFKTGAVQEEIMLMIHPESLMGRAVFTPMSMTGACVVMGAVRVSNYVGYGSKKMKSTAFTFNGGVHFNHNNPLDSTNRALTEILAFDAQNFKSVPTKQYRKTLVTHEFNRAVSAFSPNPFTDTQVPIVSGLWGSGDFGGDPVLKVLLQVAAASATNRRLILVKIGAKRKAQISKILTLAISMRMSCGEFIDIVKDAVNNVKYKQFARQYNADQTAFVVTERLRKVRRQMVVGGGGGGGGGVLYDSERSYINRPSSAATSSSSNTATIIPMYKTTDVTKDHVANQEEEGERISILTMSPTDWIQKEKEKKKRKEKDEEGGGEEEEEEDGEGEEDGEEEDGEEEDGEEEYGEEEDGEEEEEEGEGDDD